MPVDGASKTRGPPVPHFVAPMPSATTLELRAALERAFAKTSAAERDNATQAVGDVYRALDGGSRVALLGLSGPTLRAYAQSVGISARGLQPELAMRIWSHRLFGHVPEDTALCDADPPGRHLATKQLDGDFHGRGRGASMAGPPSIFFLRRAREENVLTQVLRPLSSGARHKGHRALGLADSVAACESRCVNASICDAYTWFHADAPEAWARSCIAQDLSSARWSPFPCSVATSGVMAIVSGPTARTRGREPASSGENSGLTQSSVACRLRMQVHSNRLDLGIMDGELRTARRMRSPTDCHLACAKARRCARSVWMSPKGEPLLKDACFHVTEHTAPGKSSLVASQGAMGVVRVPSRRVSSAQKSTYPSFAWQSPTDALSHALLPGPEANSIQATLARVARGGRLAILTLHDTQLSLAHQFICHVHAQARRHHPHLWICGDALSCKFLEEREQEAIKVPGALLGAAQHESADALVRQQLRVALAALLYGHSVLLADPGTAWLQSPWRWLAGPFDIVGAPEQRLGEGFGFPLGADFLYFHSTNASINVVLHLIERTQAAIDSKRPSLEDALNDMLFLGVSANGSMLSGRHGAQLRRPEWAELRIKMLDMEMFPPPHVSGTWWHETSRALRAERVVVLRTAAAQTSAHRLRALEEAQGVLSGLRPTRSLPGCVGSAHDASRTAGLSPTISVVMLSHGHASNIEQLCQSLLPCSQSESERAITVAGNEKTYVLQAVIVEDGSSDDSPTRWRSYLGSGSRQSVRWLSRNGSAEAAVAFPAASIDNSTSRLTTVADILLFAPNQHEIRSYHQGFVASWGDVLVTLQDDELYRRDDRTGSRRWLADALKLFDLHPDLSMVSCNAGFLRNVGFACDMFDPHYKRNCCYINRTSGCWGEEIAPIPMHDPRLPTTPFMFVAGLNFGPFIVRRRAYFELGGFDTSWSSVGDPGIGYDIEFSLRAQQRGHLIGVMKCDGIQRRVGGGSSLASAAKRKLRYIMERQNNQRLDKLFFDNRPLMQRFVGRAMRENQKRLAGPLPTWDAPDSSSRHGAIGATEALSG